MILPCHEKGEGEGGRGGGGRNGEIWLTIDVSVGMCCHLA